MRVTLVQRIGCYEPSQAAQTAEKEG